MGFILVCRLRSGNVKTLSYDTVDFNRVFDHHGGFARAGSYGTNILYTWRTLGSGVQSTVKFYMQVRSLSELGMR
jgi:hypothetical protein